MSILFFGPSSSLNYALVERLSLQDNPDLVWLISSQGQAHKESIELSNSFIKEPSQELGLFIENNKDSIELISGLIYADSKGGVRPLKLNSSSFVEDMFQQNIFSFFDLIRSMLKLRLLENGASIVCLSSVSSTKGLKSKSVYSASKAALDAAVRGTAAELASRKIRVNSIQKGWVDVDMELDFIKNNRELSNDEDFKRQLLGPVPVHELARLIAFLLTDQLSTMTGANLVFDGGYSL